MNIQDQVITPTNLRHQPEVGPQTGIAVLVTGYWRWQMGFPWPTVWVSAGLGHPKEEVIQSFV